MEHLKTKYAKETTEAFKKMIKTKQPKKVWVDKSTEFKGEFEKLCTKGYKQIFTDEVFEIVAIPSVNSPTYSLIDAEKEEINGKFYEKELNLVGNKADYNKNGQ